MAKARKRDEIPEKLENGVTKIGSAMAGNLPAA